MIITKKRDINLTKEYDLFLNIENNLRELGFGDVSVNKNDFNKLLYDILLKLESNDKEGLSLIKN